MSNALSASSLYSQNVSLTYTGYDKASNRTFMEVDNPKGGTDKRCSYWTYDALNRVVKAQDPPAATGATAGFTYFAYDQNSNRIVVDDQEFRRTYFDFDVLNRQSKQKNAFLDTTYMGYDVRNSLKVRIDPVGRAVYHDYDALNRAIRQSNALGQVSYFGYDPRSNRVLSQNPRGYSTYFTFDLLGRLTHQKDALNGVRYFGYDQVGNKILEVDERFGWTYFAYDQANRTRMVMDQGDDAGVRGQTSFGWDAVGLMRMKTDADGRLTFFGYFGYDASRRPTTEMHDTDPWLYYTYDSVGNLIQTSDETGTFGQTFDALNRLVTKQTKADTVYYVYDKSGQKTQVTQPSSGGVFAGSYYSYDAAGRLQYVAPFAGPPGGIRPAYLYYDASNMLTKKILFGNNVMAYYSWDNASRLQQLKNLDSAAATINYFGYARDANGNTTSTARESGMTIYYAYDTLDRLTQESWVGTIPSVATIYGFYYNYDTASNRYFQFDYRNAASPTRTYWTYDARNVLIQETTLP